MAKAKVKSKAELEQELKLAQERISLLEEPKTEDGERKYLDELKNIRRTARVTSDKIIIKEIADHKNISLWTKDGKKVGPMHKTNAERTLSRFYEDLGVILSTRQPTEEEISKYKRSAEYKKKMEKLNKSRAEKDKSRKAGQIEKLAQEIAKMSGQTVEAINAILKAKDVKPLSEGRK